MRVTANDQSKKKGEGGGERCPKSVERREKARFYPKLEDSHSFIHVASEVESKYILQFVLMLLYEMQRADRAKKILQLWSN